MRVKGYQANIGMTKVLLCTGAQIILLVLCDYLFNILLSKNFLITFFAISAQVLSSLIVPNTKNQIIQLFDVVEKEETL